MDKSIPYELVRFHVFMARDQVGPMVRLARKLARIKGRHTRLGEALQAAITAALRLPDDDLLALAPDDLAAPYWAELGEGHKEPKPVAMLPRVVHHEPSKVRRRKDPYGNKVEV